ncbi:MAG TPA: TPM domain-containing protein [Longimicrobium sp.]
MQLRALGTTLLLALVLFLAGATYPEPVGYVNDFVGILPDEQRDALEVELRDYEARTTVEVAVAIVGSLDGESISDYANGLFRAWGVGKAGVNNGVLVLVALRERRVRIEVGYGLEARLTDDAAARIMRESMVPSFRAGDYPGGIRDGVARVLAEIGDAPAPVPAPDSTIADTTPIPAAVADTVASQVQPPALYEPPAPEPPAEPEPTVVVQAARNDYRVSVDWNAVLVLAGLVAGTALVIRARRRAALRLLLTNTTIPERRAQAADARSRLAWAVAAARPKLPLPGDVRRLDQAEHEGPRWIDTDEAEIAEAERLVRRHPGRAERMLAKAAGTEAVDGVLAEIAGRVAAYQAATDAAPGAIHAAGEAIAAMDEARAQARAKGYRDRREDDLTRDGARHDLDRAREAFASLPADPESAVRRARRSAQSAASVSERIAERIRLRAHTDSELPKMDRKHAALSREMDAASAILNGLRTTYPYEVWAELAARFDRARKELGIAGEGLREARAANSMEAQKFERAADLIRSAATAFDQAGAIVTRPAAVLAAQRAAEAELPTAYSDARRARRAAQEACSSSDIDSKTKSRFAGAEAAYERANADGAAVVRDAVSVRTRMRDLTTEYGEISQAAAAESRAAIERRRIERERQAAEERRQIEERRQASIRRSESRSSSGGGARSSGGAVIYDDDDSPGWFSSSSGSSSSSSSSSSGSSSSWGSSSSSSSSSDSSSSFGGGDSGGGGADDEW